MHTVTLVVKMNFTSGVDNSRQKTYPLTFFAENRDEIRSHAAYARNSFRPSLTEKA